MCELRKLTAKESKQISIMAVYEKLRSLGWVERVDKGYIFTEKGYKRVRQLMVKKFSDEQIFIYKNIEAAQRGEI